MFDRFFLFSPTRFDNRRQSSPVVVTVLAGRSETVSPLKQFPRVRVSIRAPHVHSAMSSGTRTARTHHHRRRIPFLSLERIEEEKELKKFFAKKKIPSFFDRSSKNASKLFLSLFFSPL